MRLFEADEFDERIQAVENRAGRIAWEVLVSLLLLSSLIYNRFTSGEDVYFVVIVLSIAVSAYVAFILREQGGVSGNELELERERLKRSKAAKQIFKRRYRIQVVWGNLFLLGMLQWEKWSVTRILIFLTVIVIGNIIAYFVMRKRYRGLQQENLPEEEVD